MNWSKVYPLESSEGLARLPQPEDQLPFPKVGPLTRRPFRDLPGYLPIRLPPLSPSHLEDAWHLPRIAALSVETPEFSPNFIPQPSTLIEGEEEYKVETIRAHRGSPGRRQYLVSWKGYSRAEDTWKPESHLVHIRFILRAYKLGRPKDFPTVTSL